MSAYNYNGIKPLSEIKANNLNIDCLYILSEKDLISLVNKNNIDYIAETRNASGFVSALLDAKTLKKLVSDLGFKGRAYEKTVNGKRYIIFKGYPGQRKLFTGTRYLSSNTKVVDMILGKKGIKSSAISGARLTIFLTVPIIVLQHILNDRFLLNELVADLSVTLMKIGISSIVSALSATAIGAVTTIAAAPVAVAIFVGIAAGYALDKLDKDHRITERLANLLDDITEKQATRDIWNSRDKIKWQVANGKYAGKGVFY